MASAALAPSKMFACATCYANGANINDPMTHGMNWAILTLGVVVGTVVATFIGYFVYIVRKGERLEAAAQQKSVPGLSAALHNPAKPAAEPAGAGRYDLEINSPEPAKV
jgi:hypothetical protein